MTTLHFETTYEPSLSELYDWKKMQIWFTKTNFVMLRDIANQYEYVLRRQQLANSIRDKWQVIDGGLMAEVIDEAV